MYFILLLLFISETIYAYKFISISIIYIVGYSTEHG